MRPARLSRTAVTLIAVCAALWGVARATGSGWIVVVVSVAAGLVITGAVLPRLALRQFGVDVRTPRDATAGETTRVGLSVTGPAVRVRCLHPAGPWRHCAGGDNGTTDFVPERRGVIDKIVLEVECGAPLGMLWWRRRIEVALESPIAVGPAVVAHEPPASGSGSGEEGDDRASRPGEGDMVRGAREYRAGDPVRLIHWAATAKRGTPMVKELEREPQRTLVVTVDLTGTADDQDVAAGRTAGLCVAAITSGRRTVLVTREAGRVVASEVESVIEVSRRLARAEAGPPASPPEELRAGETVVVRARAEGGQGR